MEVFRVWGTILLKGADTVKKQLGQLDLSAKNVALNMTRAGTSLMSAGQTMAQVSKTLFRNVTVPIVAAGTLMVKTYADFDKKMTESLAIIGDVSDDMRRKMEDAAIQVSKTTRFSAAQAAEGYYFLASAGLSAAQSIEALPLVAAFAQAGQIELARATELLTGSQSALGLTMKDDVAKNMENMARVSDVLTEAANRSNGSVEQFAEALSNKAGAALRLLDKDVEEGVAVLSVYADQNLKGASAGEALNISLRDLQRASINNRKEFDKYGVQVYDNNGQMRNMADIIGDLENALNGMSDEQVRSTLMAMGFQERSINATMALLGTSDAIRTYEKGLREAGGTTKEVADKQINNLSDAFGLLWRRVQAAEIEIVRELRPTIERVISDDGPVGKAIKKVEELAVEFAGLSSAEQDNILKWAAIAAASPLLLGAIANVTTALGGILTALGWIAAHPVWIAIMGGAYLLGKTLYLMNHPESIAPPSEAGQKIQEQQRSSGEMDYWTPPTVDPNIPKFHGGGEFRAPPGRREGLALLSDGERVSTPGQQGGHYTMDINVNVSGGTLDEARLTRVAEAGLMQLIRRGDRRLPNRAAMTGQTW